MFYNNLNIASNSMATLGQIYYPDWNDFIGNGWIMGMLVLIASLAQGSLSQASTHIVNMVGIRLRTSIQGLIYRKTLLISSSCFFATDDTGGSETTTIKNTTTTSTTENEKSNGKSQSVEQQRCAFDSGTITNLMSEDALNVMSFFWIAHYVWAIPLKVKKNRFSYVCFSNLELFEKGSLLNFD